MGRVIELVFYMILCGLLLTQKASSKKTTKFLKNSTTSLQVKNNSSVYLKDKDISLKRSFFWGVTGKLYPVLKLANGTTIPSQTEDFDADGKWDNLYFVLNIKPKSMVKVFVEWQTHKPVFVARSTIRFGKRSSSTSPVVTLKKDTFYPYMLPSLLGYEPYQTDGPTWENDKVGFRHYFDGRNSKDLFGKRVSWMSPKNVGLTSSGAVEDNYHVLKDWGRDILPVGNSVGLGGVGLLINKKLNRLGVLITDTVHNIDSTNFNILTNGPVMSSFSLKYTNWKTQDGRIYQVSETPVIWPGKYAYQNNVKLSGLQGDEELVIGLSKKATNQSVEVLRFKNWVILYTHDHQSYNKEFIIGLAIMVPTSSYLGFDQAPEEGNFASSYYARLKLGENKLLTYYAVGCWEVSDLNFKSELKFKEYLTLFVEHIDAKITTTLLN